MKDFVNVNMLKGYIDRKGQGLPLNTIVLAILVIIVLLFIIVFFAGQVGQTGEDIEETRDCSYSNPAIQAMPQYDSDNTFRALDEEDDSCEEMGSNLEPVTGMSGCCVEVDAGDED